MMRNAGMAPKPVGADMPMPMRHDIEKFRQAVDAKYDDPKIPGKDDVPGDQDLKAGVLGTLGGAALGNLGGAASGISSKLADLGTKAAGKLGLGKMGTDILSKAGQYAPAIAGAYAGDKLTGDSVDHEAEGYANAPDEDYAPYTDVIKTGNDLNKSKKSYPKVAGGDNPMNLADKIKEELTTLYKEYKG
mgnify:FL=1